MATYTEAKQQKSSFWRTKPVMKFNERYLTVSCQIDPCLISTDHELPHGYTWETVCLSNVPRMTDVANFVQDHAMNPEIAAPFVRQYTVADILWQIGAVGCFLLVTAGNTICGLIGISIKNAQIWNDQVRIAQPMFLTVDPKYRKTGLAQTLMDEAIFIAQKTYSVMSGLFCTNRIVPAPVARIKHFCRPINYRYLHEVHFLDIPDIDIEAAHNKTKIRLKPNPKYKPADKTEFNVNTVYDLYTKFMKTFNLHLVLSVEEVAAYFFADAVKTLIIYNDKNEPVDFVTYNTYDAIDKDKTVKCANILMYSSLKTQEDVIIINTLKQMSADGIHVVFISDIMGTSDVVLSKNRYPYEDTDDEDQNMAYDVNFVVTPKRTFINLFNWKCPLLKQTMTSWLLF